MTETSRDRRRWPTLSPGKDSISVFEIVCASLRWIVYTLLLIDLLAGAALASTIFPKVGLVKIVSCQRMAAKTMSLAKLPPGEAKPSPRVFGVRDDFKMIGANAAPIAAEMVQLQAGRNRAVHFFVNLAMGRALLVTNMNYAISVFAKGSNPFPAPIFADDVAGRSDFADATMDVPLNEGTDHSIKNSTFPQGKV